MRSDDEDRSLIGRVFGRLFFADRVLSMRTRALVCDKEELVELVELGDDMFEDWGFVRRLQRRYDSGVKSRFYALSSRDARHRYDKAWHYLGFILKENKDYIRAVRELF